MISRRKIALLIAPDLKDELSTLRDGNTRVVLENEKLRSAVRPSDPAQEPEAVAWQFQCADGKWIGCDEPSANELRDEPEKFRKLYTRPSLDREAALLAICRTMHPAIFRRGLHPLEKDGPATRATIAETVNTATKSLDAILALIEGRT